MDWIKFWSVIKVILEFLPFVFASYEVLGDKWIGRLEKHLENNFHRYWYKLYLLALLLLCLIILPMLADMILDNSHVSFSFISTIFNNKRWLYLYALAEMTAILLLVILRILPKLNKIMLENTDARKTGLWIGAIMFVVAFVIDLVVTIVS